MATAAQYQVFGAAQVWVGTGSGTGGARLLQFLGTTEEGVVCTHRKHREPIKTDVAGTAVPAEFLLMGEDAIITCNGLMPWSKTILDLILSNGDATAVGGMPTAGTLVGSNSYAFHLAIVPPTGSNMVAREYYTAMLHGETQDWKLSSRQSKLDIKFYAWPFIPAKKAAAFDAPYASTVGAAVMTSKDAVLFVDGTISSGRFDSATI